MSEENGKTPKQVLVIDDEPSISRYLCKLLQRLGYQADVCQTGREALERVARPGYDLILSDLNMPGEPNGIELIRQLRALRPECPLVVVSGHPSEERLDQCREMGVREFLTKPFEMAFVRDVMEQLFGKSDAADTDGKRRGDEA